MPPYSTETPFGSTISDSMRRRTSAITSPSGRPSAASNSTLTTRCWFLRVMVTGPVPSTTFAMVSSRTRPPPGSGSSVRRMSSIVARSDWESRSVMSYSSSPSRYCEASAPWKSAETVSVISRIVSPIAEAFARSIAMESSGLPMSCETRTSRDPGVSSAMRLIRSAIAVVWSRS